MRKQQGQIGTYGAKNMKKKGYQSQEENVQREQWHK